MVDSSTSVRLIVRCVCVCVCVCALRLRRAHDTGTPLEIDMARWLCVRSLVCGRLVNVSVRLHCPIHVLISLTRPARHTARCCNHCCCCCSSHCCCRGCSVRTVCMCVRCMASYCADDWLLKYYFAAREVTNSISGLRPVTLDMEKQTAEAQEAVQRLAHKQQQLLRSTEERGSGGSDGVGSGNGSSGGSDSSSGSSNVDRGEEDEKAVDESEGAGELPAAAHDTQPSQQQSQQPRRGGDADGYGIENWDLTGVVDGHTDYPRKIRDILDTVHFRP